MFWRAWLWGFLARKRVFGLFTSVYKGSVLRKSKSAKPKAQSKAKTGQKTSKMKSSQSRLGSILSFRWFNKIIRK